MSNKFAVVGAVRLDISIGSLLEPFDPDVRDKDLQQVGKNERGVDQVFHNAKPRDLCKSSAEVPSFLVRADNRQIQHPGILQI